MYAIIHTGGKQYRVEAGDNLTVERLPEEAGKTVTFDQVFLVVDGETTHVGNPTVKGATVTATIDAQTRAKKIRVEKFKSKVRYRRVHGHRQHESKIKIVDIKLK